MIEIKEEFDKSDIYANISRDIHQHAIGALNPSTCIVFAGNYVYEVLLAENESQMLCNGDIEFRRATGLGNFDALIIDRKSFEAIELRDFDL